MTSESDRSRIEPIVDAPPAANAAARELRTAVDAALRTAFEAFTAGYRDYLEQQAESAMNPAEERRFRDAGRRMERQAPDWTDGFLKNIDARLVGGRDLGDADRSESGARARDAVAMARILLVAEQLHQKRITELDARLNRIRLNLYVPIHATALAPTGLCQALQATAESQRWPSELRQSLYEQFDRHFLAGIDSVYGQLMDAVKGIGTPPDRRAVAAADNAAPADGAGEAPAGKRRSAEIRTPTDTTSIDPATEAMLRRCALETDGEGYTDGLLAADLLALMDDKPLPGLSQDKHWVPLQRMSLAGHFLNEIIADPMVPADLQAQHEAMRLPLVKSAIVDESVFTEESHPLASLINELMTKAAASRLSGDAESRKMAELLKQVLEQFDLSPDFVRDALPEAKPIAEPQIRRFFDLQRRQAEQRRDFVVAEAKRKVAAELEQTTFGRDVPPAAVRFLNRAWGPLMTKHLIRFGATHPRWKICIDRIDRLVDLLERRRDGEPPREWAELLETMRRSLVDAGAGEAQVNRVIEELDGAWSGSAAA